MKNFNIFKNDFKKEGSKAPDYKIMASLSEGEKMIELGGCWLKEGKKGKYFSCRLNDAYADHIKGIARKGFILSEESQTQKVQDYSQVTSTDQIPF